MSGWLCEAFKLFYMGNDCEDIFHMVSESVSCSCPFCVVAAVYKEFKRMNEELLSISQTIKYSGKAKRNSIAEKTGIMYEGFFTIEGDRVIESRLMQMRKLQDTQGFMMQVAPSLYHVTTVFMPKPLHEKWYGIGADVLVSGYLSDDQVNNPKAAALSQAEGFQVESIRTENEELNIYLSQLVKKFHITTSYSQAAIDTNFADWSKAVPCKFSVRMIFGGFDVEKQQIVIYGKETDSIV